MRLFFYGTLMDRDVQRMLLGPEAPARLALGPAVLPGYRCLVARHARYPVLVRRGAGRVSGLLTGPLGREDLLRIAHFEGPQYLPERCVVLSRDEGRAAAWMLLPVRADDVSDEPWTYRLWQVREKRLLLANLPRWLKEYERFGAHSIDIAWRVRRLLADPANVPAN